MSSLSQEQQSLLSSYSSEQRFNYCVKEIAQFKQVWILTDDDGCVMLNTEEEDCVPVWPNEAFANQWANEEWQHCKALAIEITEWKKKWTPGLLDDDLCLVVFPNLDNEGVISFPDDFELALNKKLK